MKRVLVIILAIFITSDLQAACKRDFFKGKDGFWFTTANVALIADYSTTMGTARSDGKYIEADPITRKIIGAYPKPGDVQRYFASKMLLNVAVQCYAPDKWNRVFFQIETLVHGSYAYNNYQIGLRFEW